MRRLFFLVVAASCGAFTAVPPSLSPPRVVLLRSTTLDTDGELIWRQHSKPLLRIGRTNGIKDSHRRSLDDLLRQHGYVCVKFNGFRIDDVADVAESLKPSDAEVLVIKTHSVLYARPSSVVSKKNTSSPPPVGLSSDSSHE
mmetsp:Transcript_25899/g.83887  ORF Transcript_25899/g.83887 Transcript_25899/m.83887 type:complete len:142 (+) Transcript_25899:1325-1750(+)